MQIRDREIIIIDDDHSFLAAIVRLVNTGDYSATGLHSLAELRDRLPLCRGACVLTDIMLAGENGLDVPNILKESGFYGPVLFMTASDNQALIDAAALLSLSPCLRKPMEADALFDALERTFKPKETPGIIAD